MPLSAGLVRGIYYIVTPGGSFSDVGCLPSPCPTPARERRLRRTHALPMQSNPRPASRQTNHSQAGRSQSQERVLRRRRRGSLSANKLKHTAPAVLTQGCPGSSGRFPAPMVPGHREGQQDRAGDEGAGDTAARGPAKEASTVTEAPAPGLLGGRLSYLSGPAEQRTPSSLRSGAWRVRGLPPACLLPT